MSSPTYRFKILVIGESSTGKTSLTTRLTKNEFTPDKSTMTIGVEFHTHFLEIEGEKIRLDIFDSAGQEKYHSVIRNYFRNAVGALLVFDISNEETFNHIGYWLDQLHEESAPNSVALLVGNKSDLESERNVSPELAKDYAEKHQMSYIETSALNGNFVSEAFERLVQSILEKVKSGAIDPKYSKFSEPGSEKKEKKSSCC